MAFVCYLVLKEANIHINLICLNRNFNNPHINVVTFVPIKQSKKPHFFHKNIGARLKSLRYVSAVRFVLTFSQNSGAF